MAVCRLRGLKSELVKDLRIVQSVTKSSQAKNKNKHQKQTHKNKAKHSNPKQNSQTEAWQVPVHGLINARVITLYHLDMVWQQKQREEHQNHKAIPEGERSNKSTMRKPGIRPARILEITWRKPSRHNSSHIVTSKQTTTKPCRNESGEKKGETDSETWANVRNDEGAPTAHRARSESAQ